MDSIKLFALRPNAVVEASREKCEICGATCRFWAKIAGYSHFRCLSCDHLFVLPRPTQAELDGFYHVGTYYGAAERQVERLRREARCRVQLLGRLADRAGVEHRLLDVGCATGIFLREAMSMGWTVTGVDRSSATASLALDAVACPVHIGVLETMRIPDSPFSVVTAWEVLEHTTNPRAFFKALSDNVQEGGILAISTPLGNGLIARVLGVRFPMLTPPEHLSIFSRKSLELLATEYGFRPVAVRSFSNLGIASISSGLCKLLFGRRPEDCSVAVRGLSTALAVTMAWIPPIIDAAKLGSELEVVFLKTKY